MSDVAVIADPDAAMAALDPIRNRLLVELAEPASAATLGERLGLPRQKVNYHLRQLEEHGLVHEASSRQWGGLKERLLVASAGSFLVSPEALGPAAADPARTPPQLSASYLLALAGRVVREMGHLVRLARERNKHLATLAIDSEIRFRSPAERAAFAQDLTRAVTALAARYHDPAAPDGRTHRLVILAHPAPHTIPEEK
ncbi:MAG: helix-turn-helix domain-containing protein [Thermomicrobiales bacterium]